MKHPLAALLLGALVLPVHATEPAQAARAAAEQWLRGQYDTPGSRVVAQAAELDTRTLQLTPCPASQPASRRR